MKRILAITLLLVFAAGVCFAASPRLACQQLLERKDIRTKGHDVIVVNSPGNYFRSVEAESDAKLLKEVRKAFEQDRKLAFNSVDRFDGSEEQEYSILNVKQNGYVVNIGFYWNDETGYVRLFIQADPAAFK
ncbi:MAG: hypothetical protein K2L76_08360 [Muribaculaceae bacterium]|nr:hypothetical protein [Muribaculaceae bacterium]